MRLLPLLWAIGAVALALPQDKHYAITMDACLAAGFRVESCREIAIANHNTDAHEWDDLAAHAQIPEGEQVCRAIDAVLEREVLLGRSVRLALIDQRDTSRDPVEVIAAAKLALDQLGRALHTVQDNCAHHGMPNPQHAWWSVSDLCRDTSLSPDLAPAATVCAEEETAVLFTRFRATLDELGIVPNALYQGDIINKASKLWPRRYSLCAFVTSPPLWDGVDRGWDNAYVRPAATAEVAAGLGGASTPAHRPCEEPPGVIDLKDPAPDVVTRPFDLTCQSVDTICNGDPNARDEQPPWESDFATVISSACSSAPAVPLGLAVALLLAAFTRRARR